MKILTAIPTANGITPETFKGIYDLQIPTGVEVDFQYFYGYRVDQVRNLIVHWILKGDYDYLLAVDHDVVLPPDTVRRFLFDLPTSESDSIVAGLYVQRNDSNRLEIYKKNASGSYRNLYPREMFQEKAALVEVDAVGFGAALIPRKIFETIPYPQFEYHPALDHNNTFSEDIDFCRKVQQAGFKIFAHKGVVCEHVGQKKFTVDFNVGSPESAIYDRFAELGSADLLPQQHKMYLEKLKHTDKIYPSVIWDIGACVLHWSSVANRIWPAARIFCADAISSPALLEWWSNSGFVESGVINTVLSDKVKVVDFNENLHDPGGNSYYSENERLSAGAKNFTSHRRMTNTLDNVAERWLWPAPDMIKIDCQGAELEILRGAYNALQHATDLIIEAQHVDYNVGAPQHEEVDEWLETQGWKLVSIVSNNGADADYHYQNLANLMKKELGRNK